MLVELGDIVRQYALVKAAQMPLHQAQHAVMAVGLDPAMLTVDIEWRQTGSHQDGIRISPLLLTGCQHSSDHLI